ncbi:RxLR-like protein [Plasmopara halstedii]|uniref:RxLR-like protein n=1 Tax=Plasmopara halstedii TaxID=4781 RepID=A0A0P1ADX6_PLAHL|nr:RxLR-like protein [Plasmopara halstedii]CEG39143.1 RxLR-like protein [Plasmopara halstedii]|eukprot:XP_024575512.1 RxLR-like protein [Plasmopara halstedii]
MKAAAIVATASMTLAGIVVNADHTSRQLIIGGDIIPMGSKPYVVGVRASLESSNHCVCALISPLHCLSSSICAGVQGELGPYFAAVNSHFVNHTDDGERIKIVKVETHPKLDLNSDEAAYDLSIFTLEVPSKTKPVSLPLQDDSQIKRGMPAKIMGWGSYAEKTNEDDVEYSDELRGVDLEIWSWQECKDLFANYRVDVTDLCAGGIPGKGFGIGDCGAPLIIENDEGDSDDVLIGITSGWGDGGHAGVPAITSRVSASLAWINSVINEGKNSPNQTQ